MHQDSEGSDGLQCKIEELLQEYGETIRGDCKEEVTVGISVPAGVGVT